MIRQMEYRKYCFTLQNFKASTTMFCVRKVSGIKCIVGAVSHSFPVRDADVEAALGYTKENPRAVSQEFEDLCSQIIDEKNLHHLQERRSVPECLELYDILFETICDKIADLETA